MGTAILFFSKQDQDLFREEKARLEAERDEQIKGRAVANDEKSVEDGISAKSGIDETISVIQNRIDTITLYLGIGTFIDEAGDRVTTGDIVTVSAIGLEGNNSDIPQLLSYEIIHGHLSFQSVKEKTDSAETVDRKEKARQIGSAELLGLNLMGKVQGEAFSYRIPRTRREDGRKVTYYDLISGTIVSISRPAKTIKAEATKTNADGHSPLTLGTQESKNQ